MSNNYDSLYNNENSKPLFEEISLNYRDDKDAETMTDEEILERDANKYLVPNEPELFDGEFVDEVLMHATNSGASDIFITTKDNIWFKVRGSMYRATKKRLDYNEIEKIAERINNGAFVKSEIESGRDIDRSYAISRKSGYYRYRVNMVGVQSGTSSIMEIVLRNIPLVPPELDKDIPQNVIDAFSADDGMCLVVGPTGSGKTTLIASIIRFILESPKYSLRILSYEAPVEFLFDRVTSKYSMIRQTEIPFHLPSFSKGVTNSLRRAPNIIFVGEMRDLETIRGGLTAAQTGHLLIGTLHANNVSDTFKRMSQEFPPNEVNSRLTDMITYMKLILSQRLVKTIDGKLTPVREYLVFDERVKEYLLKNMEIDKIAFYVADMVDKYGQSFVKSAKEKYDNGIISEEVYVKFVRDHSTTKTNFLE